MISHVYINPQTKAFIEQLSAQDAPDPRSVPIEELRAMSAAMMSTMGPPERPVFSDEFIKVPGKAGDINCRVITPIDPGEDTLPVLLYFMGGTYAGTSAANLGGTPSVMADEARCIVVIPEHRLPPENRFPAAFDDVFSLYEWMLKNAHLIKGDAARIAVGGASSAGTLAASVCLDAKEAGLPQPVLQWLDVPLLDQIGEYASVHEMSYLVDRSGLRFGSFLYFGHDNWQEFDVRASPIRAADVSGLAPAYITTAELDPLRDEGKAYAVRLRKAGVPCTHICYEGQIHGFSAMGAIIEEGTLCLYQAAAALRFAFDKALSSSQS